MADKFTPHDFEPLDTSDFQQVPSSKPKSTLGVLGQKLSELPKQAMETISGLIPSKETAEDTAFGAVQGATLGFADEAEGGIRAGADVLTGGKNLQDFPELYRQYQKAAEKQYDDAKTRSPNAFLAGELGGGLLTGVATAGGGLAAGAGRVGLREALKAGGKMAAAKELAARAVPGLATGAVAGFGTSKHTLDTPEEREKLGADVIGSSAMGGALSAGVPTLVEGLGEAGKKLGSKAASYIEDSPFLRQIGKSYGMGRAGNAVSEGESAINAAARQQTADISEIANKFHGAQEQLGKEIGTVVNDATRQGVKVKVLPEIGQASQDLRQAISNNKLIFGTKETSQVIDQLRKLGNGELTPNEARTLKQNLFQMMGDIDDPAIKNTVGRFSEGVDKALNQSVDGLEALNKKYSSFLSSGPEVLLAKGQPTDIVKKFMSSLSDPRAKVAESVQEMLSSLTAPGTSKSVSRRTYTELLDRLNQFDQQNPGLLQKLGMGTPEEFGKNLLDKADRFAIQRQALGYEPHGSPVSSVERGLFGLANTGRGAVISGANLAGRGVKKLADSGPARFSRNLYNASNDELTTVADQLEKSGIPGMDSLGGALRKGLENKNQASRNAALFTILQDPKARLLISPEEVGE